ncbi:MAG: nicotinate phosphoribosyltransferase [Candidatus Izemoplasmatales bacterium]
MEQSTYALVQDFYELTMAGGYLEQGFEEKIVYFDLFYRTIPDHGGYVVSSGLEQVINYLTKLSFTKEEIAFLRSKQLFSELFLEYLSTFSFTGELYAMKEGTLCFPYEPILTVKAPLIEAQLVESFLLLTVNHQSLIATKASRMKFVAKEKKILEFGTRRAHGKDASVYGARAAYIGGVDGTSNVEADYQFGVPALGTMAHSWIQMFDTEYEAFLAYAKQYPYQTTLLVDTYHVLESGIPNAIKVFKEIQVPLGIKNYGIRIDSGDLSYLSKQARKMLDDAMLQDCKITVSNSLDEFLLTSLLDDGAPIDSFGIGEKLITSASSPVFGGVYKLVAVEDQGKIIPKIKLSENPEKVTLPSFKQVYRFIDKLSKKAIGDVITLYDEVIDTEKPYRLFDPLYPWKEKNVSQYEAIPLLELKISKGKLVNDLPSITTIRKYVEEQKALMWDEVLRLNNPQKYIVDYSEKLYQLKSDLIIEMSTKSLK